MFNHKNIFTISYLANVYLNGKRSEIAMSFIGYGVSFTSQSRGTIYGQRTVERAAFTLANLSFHIYHAVGNDVLTPPSIILETLEKDTR